MASTRTRVAQQRALDSGARVKVVLRYEYIVTGYCAQLDPIPKKGYECYFLPNSSDVIEKAKQKLIAGNYFFLNILSAEIE
jgi:hypothetical protein